MAGDPTKAALWTGADVYIAPVGTALPANIGAAFSATWKPVGLLDGDRGFEHTRSVDKSDYFAWGQILVRTARRNFKQEIGLTMLEYNDEVRSIVWPGSTASALKVPTPTPLLMALELNEGTRKRRLITSLYAEFDADSFTENEAALTNFPVTATIFPKSDGELWVVQDTASNPVTALAISGTATISGTAITKLTATATFTDASTADVSDTAVWTTSDATKATVKYGYVKGVASGTPSITAAFGGQSDSETVTVS